MENKRRLIKPIALVSALIAVAVIACLIFTACAPSLETIDENGNYTFGNYRVTVNVPTTTEGYNVNVSTVEATPTNETLVEMLERVRPTVVDVYASSANSSSAGSGVIIGASNKDDNDILVGGTALIEGEAYDYYYVVTNHHVVASRTSFSVELLFINEDDSEETVQYSASLIGGSPSRDIAVLRIERTDDENITVADIVADSGKVKVGTEVLAIGNPMGILGGTVTRGIISATARQTYVSNIGNMTLLQTDAAINGGNSGGGLFDTSGLLVGIVNSGYETDSSGDSVEGLNFAIPANDALFAAQSLMGTYSEGTEGTVTSYGYVEGDADFGLTCSSMTFSNSTSSINAVYAYSVTESSPIYGKVYSAADYNARRSSYFHAIAAITYGSVPTTISTVQGLSSVLQKVTAGTEVTFTLQRITPSWGGRYTISDETEEVTVTATQFVYSI